MSDALFLNLEKRLRPLVDPVGLKIEIVACSCKVQGATPLALNSLPFQVVRFLATLGFEAILFGFIVDFRTGPNANVQTPSPGFSRALRVAPGANEAALPRRLLP